MCMYIYIYIIIYTFICIKIGFDLSSKIAIWNPVLPMAPSNGLQPKEELKTTDTVWHLAKPLIILGFP